MPDPMIEIAKIIDSQIESRLSKFKKDMKSYVDNRRVGAEQIEPGAIIPPKVASGTLDLVARDINLNGKVTFTGLDPSTRSQVTNGNNANTTVNTWRTPGQTTINGGMIETNSVKAAQVDVDNLFADAATINALKTKTVAAVEAGGGAIKLSSEGLALSGAKISMNASGTKGDLIIDEEGVSAKNIISDSVAPVYLGPSTLYVDKGANDAQVAAGTHFRSIQAAFNAVNKKFAMRNITINVTQASYYENDLVLTVYGGHRVEVNGNNSILPGSQFLVRACTGAVRINDFKLTHRDVTSHGFYAFSSLSVRFTRCVATAKGVMTGTYAGFQLELCGYANVFDCEMYPNGGRAVRNSNCGSVTLSNNKGNGKIVTGASITCVTGTQPDTASEFTPINDSGGQTLGTATVDFGAAAPPEPTTVTQTFAAITMRTMYGTGDWPATWMSSQNYTLQGYTDGAKTMYTSMWFSTALSALANKTILEAKITLRRILPTGRSGPAKINGYYGALGNTAGSGAPSSRVSMGLLGTLEQPQTGTFSIPVAAVSYLAGAPTGRCIMINPKDSALWNGEPYSENHARFAGVGSAYVPELEVTYTP